MWPHRRAHQRCDIVDAVLEGAAQYAEGEVEPLNRVGDTVGAKWSPDGVAMPPGFHEAYRHFVEGGWGTISAPEEAGGQGLPLALGAAVMEDLNAANLAFALCPMLTMGAIEALEAHGSRRAEARLSAQGSSAANGPRP
jgi:alkylation response protein AidB-like acyl-CoA dehydrogenase